MIVETPPENGFKPSSNDTTVFLGGCIGGCKDWQHEFIEILGNQPHVLTTNIHLYNPRWEYKWTGTQQIEWEFNRLREADVIVMWFGAGGMNRIVFYELGMWINSTGRKAVIGCDPDFERKEDVVIQTKLARPDLIIYTNLEDLVKQVISEVDS